MKNILRTLAAFALSIVVLTAGHEIVMAGGPYFHRVITQSIEFRQDESTLPAAGTVYIARDGSGELTLNVLTGQSINFAVNAVDILSLALAGLDFSGNSLDNTGFIILNDDTAPAGTEVFLVNSESGDLSLNVATSDSIHLSVNDVDIVSLDVVGLTMGGNSISGSGFISLTADTNPAGTVEYISRDNTDDMTLNVPTGGSINLSVAGTDEVLFTATAMDLTGLNISNGGTIASGAITIAAGDLALGGGDIGGFDQLQTTDATTLTPDAPGAITVTQMFHDVTAITGQTVDSIATINGGVAGDIIILTAADTDDIFFDVDGGNLRGIDRSVFEVGDMIMYLFDGSNWQELSFSDNN